MGPARHLGLSGGLGDSPLSCNEEKRLGAFQAHRAVSYIGQWSMTPHVNILTRVMSRMTI